VQAADAAQIRLHELERVLPHGTREIDHRVETAEDWIVIAMARAPTLKQPFLFRGGNAKHVADEKILKIKLRQSLERVLQRERNVMQVRNLIGQGGQRTRKQADDFGLSIPQINQVPRERFVPQLRQQIMHLGIGKQAERLAHLAGQVKATESHFFGQRKHDGVILSVLLFRTPRLSGYRPRRTIEKLEPRLQPVLAF
jgi:hypothetical protein